jgi:hypothetical protein
MLTQGYRRFEWKQILNDKMPKATYQVEKLLSVAGTVKTLEGKPVHNSKVSLASIRQMLAMDTVADANGDFRFDNLSITDTAKLYLRPEKANKEKIEIKRPDYPAIRKMVIGNEVNIIPLVKPEVVAEMKKQYEGNNGNMKTGITLKQVDIKSNKNPLHITPLIHSDNLNGAGQANQIIMGNQLVGCPDISTCLTSLLRGGVRFIFGPGGTPIIYSSHTPISLSGVTKPMAVLLNGVIMDQSVLKSVSPTDIYSIEVLESHTYTAIYGSAAYGGLLIITTKRGDESGLFVSETPGLTMYNIQGFYRAHQFYSPKYPVKVERAEVQKLHNTIFWKPYLITNKDGIAIFNWCNSNRSGTYRVVVEGINSTGSLGIKASQIETE